MEYAHLAAAYARHRRIHPGVLSGLLEIVPLGPSSRVLEIGCGTGSYISAIRKQVGCDCAGCDPSVEMLAIARRGDAEVRFHTGRAETLDLSPDSFDLIFSVDVIHHVEDRPAHLRAAAAGLRAGGALCTATDSDPIIRGRQPQSRYFPETIAVELARYPRIEDLKAMMAEVGLTRIEERTVESVEELTDIAPFREKAFSSLHLIPEAAFAAGIIRMEEDLRKGPIPYIRRYAMISGRDRR